MTVRSLSRRPALGGNGAAFPNIADRERARDYLATRMLNPSCGPVLPLVERELDQMTQRERVFLEIEIGANVELSHSFDYDAGPWSRR